jgi:hypothetical protein
VERENNKSTSVRKDGWKNVCDGPSYLLEFTVDDNSQRLEDAGCRMPSPSRAGDDLRHELCKLFSGPHWSPLPLSHDLIGDPRCCSFLAVLFKHCGQLFPTRGCQEFCGRLPGPGVEPHVQLPAGLDPESPCRVGQLI